MATCLINHHIKIYTIAKKLNDTFPVKEVKPKGNWLNKHKLAPEGCILQRWLFNKTSKRISLKGVTAGYGRLRRTRADYGGQGRTTADQGRQRGLGVLRRIMVDQKQHKIMHALCLDENLTTSKLVVRLDKWLALWPCQEYGPEMNQEKMFRIIVSTNKPAKLTEQTTLIA